MKLSLNWIKEFTHVSLAVDELVEKIGAQLGAVDEVIDLGEKYQGILIVRVVKCVKHPNADKLSFCLVDDGGVNKKVKRDKEGLIEVVCGAPNVKAGMLAAWIPPGAIVPSTFDKDPFVIEQREIRGIASNGMLASPKELDFGDSHEGLLIIEQGKAGDSFAEVYGLNDQIIDIENKMFTHRPDLFGMLGLAREVAGIQHKSFKSPAWYREDAALHNDGRKNVLKLDIKNDLPKLVPRFSAVAIKDIKVADSPAWLKAYLVRVGVRPINNIVDITNYMMLETAQPLHAYDYDKVASGVLGVRLAKAGEQVVVIGGKSIKLNDQTIVITDGDKAIGLGGVMGGQSTEVSQDTKNIIIEVANFDMNTTRRSAMAYGLFSDAATRFTKNQPPRQTLPVLCRAVELTKKVAGGRVASPVVDKKSLNAKPTTVTTPASFINDRLGLALTPAQIKKLLENVEFSVHLSGQNVSVTAPFWRTDIEIPEDIVEEVGRLYGYDHLPLDLPQRSVKPTQVEPGFKLKSSLRQSLAEAGANEVLSYSFVHGKLLDVAGQDAKKSYHIKNALSPALQYYRQSLMPSLLSAVHPNIKAGYDKFAIFEIGTGHIKKAGSKDLPYEMNILGLAFADSSKQSTGAAYFEAKAYLEFLAAEVLNSALSYEPIAAELDFAIAAPYEPSRSTLVKDSQGNMLGIVGEFKDNVMSSFKLPKRAAGFEIDLAALAKAVNPQNYSPLNKYPELAQDITLRTASDVAYIKVEQMLRAALDGQVQQHGFIYRLQPLGAYQITDKETHKQTTWRITLSHPDRTLKTDEVNKVFDMLEAEAKSKFKAERV